ncbi:hypothetical protein ACTID9_25260 [Brevibacillus fluminis]|uniref:hypothetical protein n=1 Tax=Brevibacillus fluminis TaxID=511487 RepID=UPI003F893AA0
MKGLLKEVFLKNDLDYDSMKRGKKRTFVRTYFFEPLMNDVRSAGCGAILARLSRSVFPPDGCEMPVAPREDRKAFCPAVAAKPVVLTQIDIANRTLRKTQGSRMVT